ncbi:MAG: hypothetical protein QOE62_209 [Actinomycetota bacterium]|nr:hypothetical protein [Actinomycetota bacterium]
MAGALTDGSGSVFLALAIFAFVAAGAAVAYFKLRARQERIAAVAALAQRIGFSFAAADDEHVVDMPFQLFARGDGREVELVISGNHNGVPLRLFDYMYYDESSDGKGGRTRSYHRYTCAIATISASCPRLNLGHETFFTRLGDHLGMGDVELEYDDFNRRFRVKCDDQKFAFSLLDGNMMQWLLGTDGFESVEVDGPWVLLARDRLDPAQWLDLANWIDVFVRQIPSVVFSTYPPR